MPLRNHFQPPLTPGYPWTSFHARWASAISDALNERLPDHYHARLTLGQPLPTLPLWLAGGPVMPVDLNATYEETCRRIRLPPA